VSEETSSLESSIEIELAPPLLHGLRSFAEHWCQKAGFHSTAIGEILSAFDEALANIHLHSYGARPGKVRIDVEHSPQELIFTMSDQGKAFPSDHTSNRQPGEMGQGGWGTLFMKKGFDRIERRRVGGKNILLLARVIPVQKGGR